MSPRTTSDIESIIWFEEFLKNYSGALLMTSHDREFMNRIVTRIAEIDGGEIIAYSGNYDFYERERTIRETNQQTAFVRQQAMLAKEQRFIERFKAHAAKAAQVQSRIKALDKIELPKKQTVVKFDLRTPARSGDQVAVLQDVHKSYGSWVICDEFSLSIRRQERWAVMGRNGGRQIHTSENNCGSRKARRRSVSARRQFDYGLLRPTISGCTRSQPDGNPAEGTSHRTASAHCEYSAALLSFQTTMSTNLSALFPVASARV